jgi:hypothetical protein
MENRKDSPLVTQTVKFALSYHELIAGSPGLSTGPNAPFQFGVELEYIPAESEALLHAYEPLPVSGLTPEEWGALTFAEKLTWVKKQAESRPRGDKGPLLGRTKDPALDWLPPTLNREDTGNLELVFPPVGSWAEAENLASRAIRAFGAGSLQAMVSESRERFFAPGAKAQLGWLNFFLELDTMERLTRGARALARKTSREPARRFLHPFLGPMTEQRHRLLRKFLWENEKGNLFDPESLARPALREHSFKFVGGTAYRPDIAGPARICVEVRDAHRDLSLLRLRVARVLFYWERGLQAFARFAEIPAFDSEADFDRLPASLRIWLREALPPRIPPEALPYPKVCVVHETYRNFAYPIRDWRPWLAALELTEEEREVREQRVREAQETYLAGLAEASSLRGEEARRAAQAHLVRWAENSGLHAAFREEEDRIVEELCP